MPRVDAGAAGLAEGAVAVDEDVVEGGVGEGPARIERVHQCQAGFRGGNDDAAHAVAGVGDDDDLGRALGGQDADLVARGGSPCSWPARRSWSRRPAPRRGSVRPAPRSRRGRRRRPRRGSAAAARGCRPRAPWGRTGSPWPGADRGRWLGRAPRRPQPSPGMVRPMPPYSSGTARAGQSRATMEPHSFSGASPSRNDGVDDVDGDPLSRNERTEERSSSCSPVNSSSTALPSPAVPVRLSPTPSRRASPGGHRIGASVPDALVSLRARCYLRSGPRCLGRTLGWVCPGGRRSEAQARTGGAGGRRTGGSGIGEVARHSRTRKSSLAYTLRCASSSTAEQRTLNPQVSGSNPGGDSCDVARHRRQLCQDIVDTDGPVSGHPLVVDLGSNVRRRSGEPSMPKDLTSRPATSKMIRQPA